MNQAGHKGRRLLVAEDEVLIAMLLEDQLAELGFAPGWHAETVAQALTLVSEEETIAGAILDLNLHGVAIDPVAHKLAERNIPFCFMTGADASLPRYPHVPVLSKPFTASHLNAVIDRLFAHVDET